MTSNAVPHLCGGIFFDLLLEAKKPRRKSRDKLNGGSDGLTIPGVYAGLIEIVTGEDLSDCAGSTLKKCATEYRKCKNSTGDYVPFTDSATQSSFKALYKTNRPCLLERTARFIEKYLNNDKCVWLVSALIETMQRDTGIADDTVIAINYREEMPVSQLHTATTIIFLPFLLSVLHYVMSNCPDCESGKATFNTWYSQVGTHSEWKFNGDIGNDSSPINVVTDLSVPQTLEPEASQKTDRDEIVGAVSNTVRIMASTLDSANHQIAEEIRQKQKKQVPPEEEPEAEHIDAEIVDDDRTKEKASQNITIIQNQTNIEHDESKTFQIDNSTVTFNL